MADYFGHWLSMGKRLVTPPKIFLMNWFREDRDGQLLWPGFGDNVRVLKWIVDRIASRAPARVTPIGNVPMDIGFDTNGLGLDANQFLALSSVDPKAWLTELEQNDAFFRSFGDRLPAVLKREHDALRDRLCASIS